jgi:hypothetical protein
MSKTVASTLNDWMAAGWSKTFFAICAGAAEAVATKNAATHGTHPFAPHQPAQPS